MRSRYPLAYLVLLSSAAIALFWHGDARQPAWVGPTTASAAVPLTLPDLVGQWSGTWVDTVYSVGGAITFDILRDGDSWFASGTIDVTAIAPFLGVLPGSAQATLSGNTISGQFACTDLGNGSFTLTEIPPGRGTAQIASATGSGTVTAPLSFGPFTFTGSVTDGTLGGSFDFTNPGGGKGVAAMTKSTAVRRASWGAMKSAYDR